MRKGDLRWQRIRGEFVRYNLPEAERRHGDLVPRLVLDEFAPGIAMDVDYQGTMLTPLKIDSEGKGFIIPIVVTSLIEDPIEFYSKLESDNIVRIALDPNNSNLARYMEHTWPKFGPADCETLWYIPRLYGKVRAIEFIHKDTHKTDWFPLEGP